MRIGSVWAERSIKQMAASVAGLVEGRAAARPDR